MRQEKQQGEWALNCNGIISNKFGGIYKIN